MNLQICTDIVISAILPFVEKMNKSLLRMSIYFVKNKQLLLLCWMKLSLVSLLVLLSLSSCKSEYEERLEEALELKERMSLVDANSSIYEEYDLYNEKKVLDDQIRFLAKVSGNEKLFLEEIFED